MVCFVDCFFIVLVYLSLFVLQLFPCILCVLVHISEFIWSKWQKQFSTDLKILHLPFSTPVKNWVLRFFVSFLIFSTKWTQCKSHEFSKRWLMRTLFFISEKPLEVFWFAGDQISFSVTECILDSTCFQKSFLIKCLLYESQNLVVFLASISLLKSTIKIFLYRCHLLYTINFKFFKKSSKTN